MAEESRIITTPQGTIMANGIHAGACLLMIVKGDENLSLLLPAEQTNELARFLMFSLGQQREAAETERARMAEEVEALATMRPTRGPRMAPTALGAPDAPALPPARPGQRQGSGTIDYQAAANAFMTPGMDSYISPTLKSAGGRRARGRGAYVADQFGITLPSAKARITRARADGLIPSDFAASRGKPPRPRGEAESNGQEVEAVAL